jgi:hypothetical protein
MTDIFDTATLTTNRLRLEPFAPHHAQALNAINNEPEVMEFLTFGEPETMEKTNQAVARVSPNVSGVPSLRNAITCGSLLMAFSADA